MIRGLALGFRRRSQKVGGLFREFQIAFANEISLWNFPTDASQASKYQNFSACRWRHGVAPEEGNTGAPTSLAPANIPNAP